MSSYYIQILLTPEERSRLDQLDSDEINDIYLSYIMRGKRNPRYGTHLSDETKQKISQNRMGKLTGEKNPNYGKQLSEKTKDLIRLAQTGDKNPRWKGGISMRPPPDPYRKSRSKLGEKNPQWKGGRTMNNQGYVMIKDWNHPRAHHDGYVLEHIVVLEKKLGRPLAKNEVGHHINGDKTDNRPENLEAVNRAYHIAFHHTNANYAKHIEKATVCSLCGSDKTKMNLKKNRIDRYPNWFYVPGHKHDNEYALCYRCYQREFYYKEWKSKKT